MHDSTRLEADLMAIIAFDNATTCNRPSFLTTTLWAYKSVRVTDPK
jgi:hypothetical protein